MNGEFQDHKERADYWRLPSPPKRVGFFALGALIWAGVIFLASLWSAEIMAKAVAAVGAGGIPAKALYTIVVLAALLFLPCWQSFKAMRQCGFAVREKDIGAARIHAARARNHAWYVFGFGAALLLLLITGLFVIANEVAVGTTFFYLPLIIDSFWLVFKAFGINVYIFCVAEIFVLILGLAVALARLAPGAAGKALRFLAVLYTDIFRGLPSIITLYLVGFGLPLTGLGIFSDISPEWFAIVALTLTYGAYVAEVYRSGIESVHWSQVSAARSLGLSYLQTMRFVVVPQAVRRVGPPLLNDFIGLQKDTALVSVIGTIDSFNQAKIVAANHFNLSPVTSVALLFVLILIPQTRLLDWWIERDQASRRAAG